MVGLTRVLSQTLFDKSKGYDKKPLAGTILSYQIRTSDPLIYSQLLYQLS